MVHPRVEIAGARDAREKIDDAAAISRARRVETNGARSRVQTRIYTREVTLAEVIDVARGVPRGLPRGFEPARASDVARKIRRVNVPTRVHRGVGGFGEEVKDVPVGEFEIAVATSALVRVDESAARRAREIRGGGS